jgi:hypothetical protein
MATFCGESKEAIAGNEEEFLTQIGASPLAHLFLRAWFSQDNI